MPRIDITALMAASTGDQSKKVEVTKRWLRAVHDELQRTYAAEDLRKSPESGQLNDVFEGLFGTGRFGGPR